MKRVSEEGVISIIVPVYNAENYLGRCIDSIINQTYRFLDIILVDDGSTDNSGKICDEYAIRDKRIRVIHKQNGGLSDARNVGIEAAKGKYIGFVDADDYISEHMYERLFSCLQRENADITMCRYQRFEGRQCDQAIDSGIQSYVSMDKYEALNNMYDFDGEAYTVAWNKLYKKSVIGEVRYPVGKINEDEFTSYRFILNAERIVFLSDILYYYYYNDSGITSSNNYYANCDVYEAFDEKIQYFESADMIQYITKTHKQYLDRIIMRNRLLLRSNMKGSYELYKMYRKRYHLVNNMGLGIGYKIYEICPIVYYMVLYVKSEKARLRNNYDTGK